WPPPSPACPYSSNLPTPFPRPSAYNLVHLASLALSTLISRTSPINFPTPPKLQASLSPPLPSLSLSKRRGVPKRLTYDEIQSKTYLEVKGTGTANQCPTIDGGVESFAFKPGKYNAKKFCFEPTSITVKAEGVSKNAPPEFQNTKLMTRLTYTLDEIEGPFEVSQDGSVKFEEKDGIDYAAVTVQLPGASACLSSSRSNSWWLLGNQRASAENIWCRRTGDRRFWTQREGASTGYDNAVALPAG
ncbi:hypothetical protein K1719_047617, partial [Acacia pycnantha]